MLDLGIHKAAIGEKFLVEGLWKRNPHNKEYETLVNGEPVHVLGQTMVVFRLASGDCREIMAAQVDITPDVDGLVLGMEWMHENTCMWNVRTGRVSAIDYIVFHAEYEFGKSRYTAAGRRGSCGLSNHRGTEPSDGPRRTVTGRSL